MVWTPPMTAINGDAFTAAEYNTHIRDNLREMMVSQAIDPSINHASGGGARWFITDGVNRVRARGIVDAVVTDQETATSSSYGNLRTVGPSISDIRTSGRMIVMLNVGLGGNTSTISAMYASFSVLDAAGNEILPPDDQRGVNIVSDSGFKEINNVFGAYYIDGLIPNAAYSVIMRYRTDNGDGTAQMRRITVMEL